MEEDGADDPERWCLEGHVVGDLVNLMCRLLGVTELRHGVLAGEDEDEVVRIDALEPWNGDHRRRAVDRRPGDLGDGDRLALVEGVGQAAFDGHPPDKAPFLRHSIERDTGPRRTDGCGD